ncbi:MAG: class I SAM-dependent methyltransferase [Nodosilinea sp. LVE1205-7]|jgi:SAM-dependent methyltransferase
MNRILRKVFRKDIRKTFPEIEYPIHFPGGETEASLFDYSKGFHLGDSPTMGELDNYLKEDFRRFVYTLNLLPQDHQGRLLEIGANPYFTSILLKKFTDFDLFFTNYFGIDSGTATQIQRNLSCNEVFEFEYVNHNIDVEDIPFEQKFDVILFCEVLEHLINDPMQALLRIKKSLQPNGILILTTPNVNRLENVARMIAGANIYDPYSGYGIYGRHNREYNKHEIAMLLSHCGFEIEEMFSSDVHDNRSEGFFSVNRLSENLLDVKHRSLDLGQYIFVRARNAAPEKPGKPTWLYRSYPASELCD